MLDNGEQDEYGLGGLFDDDIADLVDRGTAMVEDEDINLKHFFKQYLRPNWI